VGFAVGDAVQTPFGKGVVRELRNNSRLSIEVGGRSVVFEDSAVAPLAVRKRSTATAGAAQLADLQAVDLPSRAQRAPSEVDLHGLTVEDALARVASAVNDAILADIPELRLIHGKSGGRIRGALERWLRTVPTVRNFRRDPRNAGVTIVSF
jgi:DNA mismatch repair protein MutS2